MVAGEPPVGTGAAARRLSSHCLDAPEANDDPYRDNRWSVFAAVGLRYRFGFMNAMSRRRRTSISQWQEAVMLSYNRILPDARAYLHRERSEV